MEKIEWINGCVALPKQRDRETDKERKGEKTSRNAVNPQATEQFSGDRKEEFLCAAGEQNREGGSRRKRETDRWKKRARTRGWPREFERSVKGFDCCVEKGGHAGRKWSENGTKWQKMATQGWHEKGCGDMWTKKEKHWETWCDSRGVKMVEKETAGRGEGPGNNLMSEPKGICGFLLITLKKVVPGKLSFLYYRSIKMETILTAMCLQNRVFALT